MADVLPYFVPDNSAWLVQPWRMRVGDEWVEVPEWIEGWDSHTTLMMRTTIESDIPRILAETQLAPDAALILAVSWTSSTSMMSGVVYRQVVRSGPMEIEVELPADQIGGTVTVISALCNRDAVEHGAPGSPSFAGSILLEHKHRVTVEGSGAMFPVAVIDFASTPFDPHASWKLEVTDDLEAPFLGGFQLLLNARDEELVKAVTTASVDPRKSLLVEHLEAGVASLLVELALMARADLDARKEWSTESVGHVLSSFLGGVRTSGLTALPTNEEAVAHHRAKLDGIVRSSGLGRAFV